MHHTFTYQYNQIGFKFCVVSYLYTKTFKKLLQFVLIFVKPVNSLMLTKYALRVIQGHVRYSNVLSNLTRLGFYTNRFLFVNCHKYSIVS